MSLTWDTLTKIGDICSILGLALTIFLTTTAYQIKKRWEKSDTYSNYTTKFLSHCQKITALLEMPDFERSTEVLDVVGSLQGDLNSLRPMLPAETVKALNNVDTKLGTYLGHPNEDNMRLVLLAMYQLLSETRYLLNKLKY